MTEQDLVNAILAWLRYRGAWAMRVNSGIKMIPQENGRQRVFRGAPAGTADIVACWHGRYVAIECKVGRNKQTEAQFVHQQEIGGAGGLYILAYSVEDVAEILDRP